MCLRTSTYCWLPGLYLDVEVHKDTTMNSTIKSATTAPALRACNAKAAHKPLVTTDPTIAQQPGMVPLQLDIDPELLQQLAQLLDKTPEEAVATVLEEALKEAGQM